MYRFFLKRIIEIIIIFICLPFFIPLYLIISIIVIIKLGYPILFIQSRPGLNKKIFKIYKFRTMKNDYDKNKNLLNENDRLTKFGNFLRSTSLDELPSLWSVFKGDMSLVGPRPLLIEYLTFYSDKQSRRHEVRPGITGWAQVNGRNAISWEEKFELDVWYVDNQSFLLDLKILWLTLKKVLAREGISPKDQVLMPRFDKLMIEREKSNEN